MNILETCLIETHNLLLLNETLVYTGEAKTISQSYNYHLAQLVSFSPAILAAYIRSNFTFMHSFS